MNKSGILLSILLILLLTAFTSCRPHYNDRLEEIENAMAADPDSAGRMLTEFEQNNDIKSLSHPDAHLYHLLRAQSRYFSDIADTINPALESAAKYFEKKEEWKRAGESHFLLGILYRNKDLYPEAIVQTLWAENYYKQINDSLKIGRANYQLGRLYSDMNDLSTAGEHYRTAKEIFEKSGESEHYPWLLMALAYVECRQDNYVEAEKISRRIVEIGKEKGDTVLIVKGLQNLLECSVGMNDVISGIHYYDSLEIIGGGMLTDTDIENVGLLNLEAGHYRKAEEYLKEIRGNEISGELAVEIALHNNDYKKAFNELRLITDYQNSEVLRYWQRDFSHIIEGYYSLMIQNQEKEIRLRKVIGMIFIVILFMVSVIIGILMLRRHRKNMAMKDRSEKEKNYLKTVIQEWIERYDASTDANKILRGKIRVMNDEINVKDAQLNSFNNSKKNLEEREHDLISKERVLAEREKATEIRTTEIVDQLKMEHRKIMKETTKVIHSELVRFLQKLKDSNKNSNQGEKVLKEEDILDLFMQSLTTVKTEERLRMIVNKRYDNIMDNFDSDFADIPEESRRLFLYYVLQFPTHVIVILLGGISENNLKTRKARLRNKIRKSEVENKKDYLFFLL